MKVRLFIVLFVLVFACGAQEQHELTKKVRPEYFRKEEILYYGKRYRIHNNYLTFGPGILNSSIRNTSQKSLGIDLQFHIRRQHFQMGVMMSGIDFGSNNNAQAHIGYGYRKETKTSNLAFFAGPSYFTGVTEINDTLFGIIPRIYTNFGVYSCFQAIYKVAYDIGFGGEVYAEFSKEQNQFGIRLIAFFSSAYAGKKRNYNPNVRSENPR